MLDQGVKYVQSKRQSEVIGVVLVSVLLTFLFHNLL